MDRLQKQIEFLLEIDKLKTIFRRNYLSDGSRVENDAEHSWYFAISALLFAEHANEKISVERVAQMGLIHDLVEIDAGDTFIYDEAAKKSQKERETRAAKRIFGILPQDQATQFMELWLEFEAGVTEEAKFARAVDRLVAVILNNASKGKAWREHGVNKERILEINTKIGDGSKALWDFVRGEIENAAKNGFIAATPPEK